MIGALVQVVCDAAEVGISPLGVDWSVRYSRRAHSVKLAVYLGDGAPGEVVAYAWASRHAFEDERYRAADVRRGVEMLAARVARKVEALKVAS